VIVVHTEIDTAADRSGQRCAVADPNRAVAVDAGNQSARQLVQDRRIGRVISHADAVFEIDLARFRELEQRGEFVRKRGANCRARAIRLTHIGANYWHKKDADRYRQ